MYFTTTTAIFSVLAFAVVGILIYALVGNDKKNGGYDSDVSYNEHVEEKESRSYDDDDHDTYSRSYDDDYRSSSSSSYGGSSYSSERVVDCPVCHGTGIDGDEECIPCSGSGQLVTDDYCGSCHKNCGCTVYLAQRGYDFCVFCLMLDCHSTRDDHLK